MTRLEITCISRERLAFPRCRFSMNTLTIYHNSSGMWVEKEEDSITAGTTFTIIPKQGKIVPKQGKIVPKQGETVPKQGETVPKQSCCTFVGLYNSSDFALAFFFWSKSWKVVIPVRNFLECTTPL